MKIYLLVFLLPFFAEANKPTSLSVKKFTNSTEVSSKKDWVLLAEYCNNCSKLLEGFKNLCPKKQGVTYLKNKIGFFVVGKNDQAIEKKLAGFSGFEVYKGSSSQFFTKYNFQAYPGLLKQGAQNRIYNKDNILSKFKPLCNS